MVGGDLHRIVYYSRSFIGDDRATFVAGIGTILASSRRNNAASGVTGALMFNAGCFGQVLEGDRIDLQATFQRIQRDPRHSEVTLLTFEPVQKRSFEHWAMGYVGARPHDAADFAAVAQDTGFDPSRASGDALLAALVKLAKSGESA